MVVKYLHENLGQFPFDNHNDGNEQLTNILRCWVTKRKLNSDDQQFYQYQLDKQSVLTSTH